MSREVKLDQVLSIYLGEDDTKEMSKDEIEFAKGVMNYVDA